MPVHQRLWYAAAKYIAKFCLKNDDDMLLNKEGDSTKLVYVKIQGLKF